MSGSFRFWYVFLLAVLDLAALIVSFTAAYILRVSISGRAPAIEISSFDFIISIILLLPAWIVLFYFLGLYSPTIYENKRKETPRLLLASVIGIMMLISLSYIIDQPLFPAKLVMLYSLIIGFLGLLMGRWILWFIKGVLQKRSIGQESILLIGNDHTTAKIASYLSNSPSVGYKIVGIVARKNYIPKELLQKQFHSIEDAIKETNPEAIFHTDMKRGDEVYDIASQHHINYHYIPSHDALINTRHTSSIVGSLPVISVHTTPLVGYGRIVKRISDILLGVLAMFISFPLWIIVLIAQKIAEPSAPIFFAQQRLSRHGKPIHILKFRTLKQSFNGLSPEEAFEKMGRPELGRVYRENGDQLDDDPRITKIGSFLRKTSLDELPQLLNVLRGDISFVGPRALVPSELRQYPYKHLILSVKSGLTGLAQVSGRRDISFEERRKIDIYYVHNWSLWLDMWIIVRTVGYVLFRRGAK